MKPLLCAMLLICGGIASADTIFDVTYLDASNNGFSLRYNVDHVVTGYGSGEGTYGDLESVIANGSLFPASQLGHQVGQDMAGAFVVLGVATTLVQYTFIDHDGNLLAEHGGVTFHPIIADITPGETVTVPGNQVF